MKTNLTKEESAHLIELGVPKEKASRRHIELTLEEYRVFDLTDLLDILPKEIGSHSCISIDWNFITEKWDVDYDCTQGSGYGAKELIDALYELLCWVITNKYLKL